MNKGDLINKISAEAKINKTQAGAALNPINVFRNSEIRKKLINERGSTTIATGL